MDLVPFPCHELKWIKNKKKRKATLLLFDTSDFGSTARIEHLVTSHLVRWHYCTWQLASRWTKHTVGGGESHIRNRCAKRRWVVNFTTRPLYPRYSIIGLDIVVKQNRSPADQTVTIMTESSGRMNLDISWRWKQEVPLKRWKLSTRHYVTFEKTITHVVIVLRKSHKQCLYFSTVYFKIPGRRTGTLVLYISYFLCSQFSSVLSPGWLKFVDTALIK
jgi:hypothetical protein